MKFRSKNESWSKGSIHYALESTQKAIKEVFPDVEDINSKYFLFIKSRLYFPDFKDGDVKSIESLITIDDVVKTKFVNNEGIGKEILESRTTQLNKSKVRTPYPNKYVYLNSMKYGRKLCNDGFILMFNSFEELQAINTIIIDWKVSIKDFVSGALNLNNKIIYHPYFIEQKGHNVFSIISHDMFSGTLDRIDDENKYLNQYDETSFFIYDNEEGKYTLTEGYLNSSEEVQEIMSRIAQTKFTRDTIYEIHTQDLELVADNTRLDII